MAVLPKGANVVLAGPTIRLTFQTPLDPTKVAIYVLLIDERRRVLSDEEVVFANNDHSSCGSVRLGFAGDVEVDLQRVPFAVDGIVVSAALDSTISGSFASLGGGRITVIDDASNANTHDLTGLTTERCVILVELYRRDGDWRMRAVSQGFGELPELLTMFGADVDVRRRRNGLSAGDIANTLGIWGGLGVIPFLIVSLLPGGLVSKLVWVTSIALLCTIGTAVIKSIVKVISPLRRFEGRAILRAIRRSSASTKRVLVALIVAFLVVAVSAFPLASELESEVVALPIASCLEVGSGNPEYARAFRNAYERHGGFDKLGCPANNVSTIAYGFHQNFVGPDGPSAIYSTDPSAAVVLKGDLLEGFRSIANGDGVQSTVLAGYPTDEGVRVDGGIILGLGGGDDFRPSAVIKKDGGRWIWVQPSIWAVYEGENGGPTGRLGFPVDDARPIEASAGVRQQFERGVLCVIDGSAVSC